MVIVVVTFVIRNAKVTFLLGKGNVDMQCSPCIDFSIFKLRHDMQLYIHTHIQITG